MKTNEPDLILHNGRITTLDAKHPEANNLAVKEVQAIAIQAYGVSHS